MSVKKEAKKDVRFERARLKPRRLERECAVGL